MLPTALVTLVTFLLDLTNSSPVYNMQPAFITKNIGFTNGRNIRNLPCVSRRNRDLTGVCMFAIDCMKSNGTHLGTCIDRFYFGSCCHVEPSKEIETNIIETNIILDSREPPQRLHNKTALLSASSTQSSLSSSISSSSTTPSLVNKESSSSSTTQSIMTTMTSSHPTIISSTISSSSISKPSSPMKPFGEKITQNSSSSTASTTETTTTAQKLQTYQIVDGTLVEATTTIKPVQATTKRPTKRPTQTSTSTTTKPKPTISSSVKPTKPSSSTSKPITKPTKTSKPTRKTTLKPTKPVTVSSTTRRPSATTTKSTSTRKPPTSKPTTRVTRPSVNATTAKPISTSPKRPQTTTIRTTRKPSIVTKKPVISITTSPASTITERATTTSPRPTSITESSTSISTTQSTTSTSTTSTPLVTTSSSSISTFSPPSEEVVSKKNVTQILESSTINTINNEILEYSSSTTSTSSPLSTSNVSEQITINTTTTSTMRPIDTSSSLSTGSPKEEEVPSSTVNITSTPTSTSTSISTSTSTSTTTPSTIPGVWTIDDPKNHTIVSVDNETLIIGNITEEWTPITTPDGWVLLPSVAPSTIAASTTKNETSMSTSTSSPTYSPSPSVEPVTTFVPVLTLAPETSSTSTTAIPTTTPSSDVTSTQESTADSASAQETTSSSASAITSIVTSTSEGEKMTTSMPSITTVGNVTVTEGDGSGGGVETSSMATSTEYVPESRPVNMSDFTDVCGRRMWPEARIVGGEKSAFGKWPWQISLRQWRTSTYLHKCGAALLNENWAITAAHCVDNVPPNDLLLRLGEHDLSTEGEPYLHEDRRVQIVASHPQFDPRTFEYDLALLRFYEPVVFQPNILPVCVPTKDENFVGRTAYVTGWGRLYEDGPLPSILQEVSVPVINNTVCESMYRSAGYIEHIPHIFICAGWRRGGFDSCEGDSGGPMVIQREDNRFLLAGVISWGIGCAEPNQPGVYTRISEFREWINQILQF